MNINDARAITRLNENWKIWFNKAFLSGDKPVSEKLCQIETSSAAIEVYNLMIGLPVFRRMKGQLETQNLKFAQFRIANEDLGATVDVPIADVRRDAIGQYANMFETLGIGARRCFDKLLAELMAASFTTLDYTGTNFFAADKPHVPGLVNGGTFTNLMTEKPSVASYEKALQLAGNIKDINGDPFQLGIRRIVVCSTKWAPTFRRILNAETIGEVVGDGAAAVSNIHKGSAELVEFTYLNTAANQDKWFLLDASWPMRAFVQQTEVAPQFVARTDPQSEPVFNRKVYEYQGYMVGAVGLGLSQLAIGSTGADAAL